MQVSIQKLPKSQIELTVEIPPADFDKYLEKAIENLSKNLEIKGFRKGSVPKEIARNYLSQKDVLEEAANLAVSETYPAALEENKIEAVDSPKIELIKIAPRNPLVYRARVSVLPEVKLPDYKKISAKINEKNKKSFAKNSEVEEKEIDDALFWLQKSRAKYITQNREARVGDFVKLKIKYQKSKMSDGPFFHDREKVNPINRGAKVGELGEEEHEGILGSGYFLPDFEKNLIGMKAGEKKKFCEQVPEAHPSKEMAGKIISLEVVMLMVQEVELPEICDDFAKSLGKFENMASLRQSISDSIKIEKEEKEKQRNRAELIEAIVRESECDLPDVLIDKNVEHEIHHIKDDIEGAGGNFQDYLANIKKTEGSLTSEEDLKKDLRSAAKTRVMISLALRQIAKDEEIKVSEEEIKEGVNKYLKRFSAIEEAKKVDQEQLKLYYEDVIRNEKTFQLLETF